MFENLTRPVEMLPKDVVIDASYYDADYYNGLPKANWDFPYTWENYKPTFASWAEFILSAFPEARSFIDVGCGKGFLERAIFETIKLNRKPEVVLHGFDISQHAIDNADEIAKPHIIQASVDEFQFKQEYDVLICLDLAEHLTEKQARDFLLRSRKYIIDACFFFIATDNEINRREPSHITLRDRHWWNTLFLECGWVFNEEMREFLQVIEKAKFISSSYSTTFVYSSR